MLELSLKSILKLMGTNVILKDVNFSVYEGDKVGLIGDNGSGKSTILKLIAGIVKLKLFPGSWSKGYDYGFISRPKHAKIAYLDQAPCYPEDMLVKEILLDAFKDVLRIEKKLRRLELEMCETNDLDKVMEQYGKAMTQFELMGGYDIEEKMSKVCAGLSFSEAFLQQSFGQLSGGEKTTVELGKILIHEPEILLLDEPTNHLDMAAIEWLEMFLKNYKGIVMIVSHDRYFLNQVTNKTMEIEFLTTKMYKGNYDAFRYQKDEALRIQADQYKEQQKEIKAMKKKIQELRQWAMQSDNNKFFQRATSIQIKLDKMNKINRPVFSRPNMRLSFNDEERSGKEAIKFDHVNKAYGDQIIFKDLSGLIHYGERVALVGENGSGKSTFIKMLLGELPCDSGELKVSPSANVAYLPQYITFENEDLPAVECFKAKHIMDIGAAREYLAKFMFYGKRVFTEVNKLSGGERIRLKLAMLLYEEVNLLILDEPTNHLDIASIETLEKALEAFHGTLLFVSHDRYFTEKLADRVLAIEDNQMVSYDNYKAYIDIKVS